MKKLIMDFELHNPLCYRYMETNYENTGTASIYFNNTVNINSNIHTQLIKKEHRMI
jgi:hypothetical protein